MVVGVLCVIVSIYSEGQSQTPSAFTYQGKLIDAGASANGQYDLEFKLFGAANAQVGAALTREDVQVTNGSFTVDLDFGQSPFVTGAASALEIGVRPGTSTGSFTTIAPRQQLTSGPYSIQTVNAQQDARLRGPGGNFIQNTTTQQPSANFNIAGTGIIGGQVGISTQTPLAGTVLDVNGVARLTPGGSGGAIQFGSPNSETGMTISNPDTRADLRFDGSSLKLVAGPAGGPPSNSSGVAINTSGEVGIGGMPQAGLKLDVGGVSRFRTPSGNINVGTPNGEAGVSITNKNRADLRFNDATLKLAVGTGTGIPPSTNGIVITPGGRVGVGTESPTAKLHLEFGGLGATGLRIIDNSAGGRAIDVSGNVRQEPKFSGIVKAMVYVNSDGTIARCYSAEASVLTSNCGITIRRNIGSWWIDLGFQVNNRFWSVTPGNGVTNIATTASSTTSTTIAVKLFRTHIPNRSGEDVFRDFMLVVY